MDQNKMMKELGIIIAPNGKSFPFGEYKPYFLRDKNNPHHFHSSAFEVEVINSDAWKELGLSNIKIEDLRTEIPHIAQLGLIIALNVTDGSFEASFPSILLASPETITEEQAKILMEKKEQFFFFDDWITHIHIIDKSGNEIDSPETMEEYYEKYIDSQILEESPKRN